MEISEDFLEGLEMVLMEEVEELKNSASQGVFVSPLDIAAGYLSPDYGGGALSRDDHIMALACIVGLTLHWLTCETERETTCDCTE